MVQRGTQVLNNNFFVSGILGENRTPSATYSSFNGQRSLTLKIFQVPLIFMGSVMECHQDRPDCHYEALDFTEMPDGVAFLQNFVSAKTAYDRTSSLFRHVTYSVIGVNAMQKAAKHVPHLQSEISAEDTARAKESKQIILQTKLIIVEILNVGFSLKKLSD